MVGGLNQIRNFQEKWFQVKHSNFTHSPKDRNGEVRKRTKITRGPCRKRTGDAAPLAENLGDLVTAHHNVLSEGCESRNNSVWFDDRISS